MNLFVTKGWVGFTPLNDLIWLVLQTHEYNEFMEKIQTEIQVK